MNPPRPRRPRQLLHLQDAGGSEEPLTQERRNDRHQAGSCPQLQDRLVHQINLLTVGVQVVTESESLGGVKVM